MDEDIELVEATPEQEEALRQETFGLFSEAEVTVNMMDKTVTVDMNDMLPGKDRITVTTDKANAAWMILNAVFGIAQKQIDKIAGKVG